ncbi:BTAD domain-containing putative transcriptional regulator [Sphingopyxis indica]|uniref:DNA-binding transcriptional activator of the SARP family n=1 Tax=Sphingopyxis indica TaxID=436663 RepID=A0A239J5R5_9SPHN|nr:BTAD domain-containing putative transcriptional regulator [Sphingopyxis indica]SNT01197.1 DNA-binding transcriptional activator of the SARP family [Sphingopyxis indica]
MHAIRAIGAQSDAAPTPTFRLLGDFTVDPPAFVPHGRKARALLARLALADGPLTRDRLSTLFWSRRAETQAHASLRQCLMELKAWTRASPPLIHADRDTVRIDRAQVADDMSFLLAACAADDTEKALRWLPGEGAALLADLGGIDEVWDDWLAAERARRHEGIVREVLAMADRLFDAGAIDQTLAVAERMTRFDPCSEHAARLVMRARWQAGDDDGVRHAWQRIEDAVARGLDGKPSPETRTLYKNLTASRPPRPAPLVPASIVPLRSRNQQTARPAGRPFAGRVGVLAAGIVALSLVGADAPRGAPRAAAFAAPVVRIEPVVPRGGDALEQQFADALAADFVRLATASGGVVRVLDGRTRDDGEDFIVRVAIDREGNALSSESRVVDAVGGSLLWSNRLYETTGNLTLLRERTAVSVANMVDCGLSMNGRDRALATNADRRVLVFAICDANRRREIARMTSLLEEMTRRWPGDASAWAWLALARAMSIDGSDRPAERERRRQVAIRDVHHALTLDPANVLALVAWSWTGRGELFAVEGLPKIDRALAIDPDFPPALMANALGLFQAGFVGASVDPAIRAAEADPTSIAKAFGVVRRLAAAGRLKDASDRFAEVERLWPGHPDLAEHRRRLAEEYGRTAAAALYRAAKPDERRTFELLLLHQIADPAADRSALDAAAEEEFARHPPVAYYLAAHYSRTGDMAKALAWLNRAPVRDTAGQWSLLYWPSVAPLRRDPRFFVKMAQIGLVDYWRRTNRWPDFCREPGLRYDCRQEAARLVALGRALGDGIALNRRRQSQGPRRAPS